VDSMSILVKIEHLVLRRKWILEQLKEFEEKYVMDSREFYEKWSRGEIPEPDDPEIHGDFLVWAGLIEELERIEKELIKHVKR